MERDRKTERMVQGIRDQAIIIEMVLIKIMVAIVVKIQQKGTRELEVMSSVSDVRAGDI